MLEIKTTDHIQMELYFMRNDLSPAAFTTPEKTIVEKF